MFPRTCGRAIAIFAAAVFLLPPAFSQIRGGQTTTPAGGGGSIPGSTTPAIPTNPQPTTPNASQGTRVPVPISGRVMLDDGGPPPETVLVERICSGNARAEGYTDHKGYFSIDLGMERGVFQDVSDSGGHYNDIGPHNPGQSQMSSGPGGAAMSDQRYMNCDLRASLPATVRKW